MKKCNHEYISELHLDSGRAVNGYLLVRKGTLIMECKHCEHTEEYFCLGGIVKETNESYLDNQ